MNLHFLGGAMEIGASCIYARIAGRGILLDSGIRQSGSRDPLPDFHVIQEQGGLDAIIISHAHMDHIGTLPIISKAYPDAPIYMTVMTADLVRVLLYDSLKIMKYREDEIPHYSEQDVLSMLKRVHPVGYLTPFPMFENFTLTLYPAGHIAGAACVYLVTEEGSLFYSGDFSSFSQRTVEGIRIPKLRPDVAIVETTYGNRLHSNRQVEEHRLVELIKECLAQKKKILIPAFALGRAQEVLLILRAAIQNQEIPRIPVYVDGMVRDINTMYTRNPTYLKNALGKRILKGNEPFYTKEIQPVAANQKREELLAGNDPVILISSSGMLTGGPSAQYAGLLAPSENACIIITGYQDEESPGRQLLKLLEQQGERKLTINGQTVPVKCRIEQVGLSAHGDKSEIQALLERLSPRRIFLVHGNQDAIDELGSQVAAEDYRRQVFLPEGGQSYELSIHGKRKQLLFRPDYTMQMIRSFTPEDEKKLWSYWQEHYFGKAFSLAQIAYIWYGKPETEEETLKHMQDIFLHSHYFSPNAKQLFLFEANTPEAVEEALAPKEWTQQELEAQIQAAFPGFSYRRLSYHFDKKQVLLQFDYPDSQDREAFQENARDFTEHTGWTAEISPSMNHNAASLLLARLFGDRLSKTSYYADRKCYAVTVAPYPAGNTAGSRENAAAADGIGARDNIAAADRMAAEEFFTETGWQLLINGIPDAKTSDSPQMNGTYPMAPGESRDFFVPGNASAEKAEQNLAFFCIDQAFSNLPHKPEKKSLKQDSQGSYLELAFISPAIGHQYGGELQALSDQIGWRIRIADKVNQNALFRAAQALCLKYGLTLLKNPSYLPEERTVQLKIQMQELPENRNASEILYNAAEEFRKSTGCECRFL